MRRIVVPLTLVLALAVAAPAQAKVRKYEGVTDPSGSARVIVKVPNQGRSKVTRFTFRQVPITCEAGQSTASGILAVPATLQRQRFKGAASNEDGALLKVKGTVQRSSASGKMRASGPVTLDDGTVGTDCDTGKVRWSADRV